MQTTWLLGPAITCPPSTGSVTDLEAAWFAIHDALPPGWAVGPLSFDPARHLWEVVARSPKPLGRGRPPEYVVGVGVDEIAALGDLATKLSDTSQLRGAQ